MRIMAFNFTIKDNSLVVFFFFEAFLLINLPMVNRVTNMTLTLRFLIEAVGCG